MKTIYEVPVNTIQEESEAMITPPPKTIYLPADKDIIEQLELGQNVELVVKGQIKSLADMSSPSDDNVYNFDVEVKQVQLVDDNNFGELADD